MNLDEALKHVAVIGAAGKMGSGISLLLLQELALMEAQKTGQVGEGEYRLDLIDTKPEALAGLRAYLLSHLNHMAERQINRLRQVFARNPKLVSNEEIIRAFVQGAMGIIHSATRVEEAKGATIIFEAVVEDLQVKSDIYHRLARINTQPFYVFTNTSSIPIHVLNDSGDLQNRIIGFHFYNPPSVQKLVELIPLAGGEPLLYEWAYELAKRLKKRLVLSRDIAGFIGNGFFIQEILFACAKVRELSAHFPPHQAVYMVNRVTEEFLLRPMGSFQLLDYVGINVASKIGGVMNAYLLHGSYDDELIEGMVRANVIGGQFPDGSQRNGLLQYEGNRVVGVYCTEGKRYVPFTEGAWKAEADKALGELPKAFVPWKSLHKEQNPMPRVLNYFQELAYKKTLGAETARAFLYRDGEIARSLVEDGIAHHIDDVKAVLQNGFYHLYGFEEVMHPEDHLCV